MEVICDTCKKIVWYESEDGWVFKITNNTYLCERCHDKPILEQEKKKTETIHPALVLGGLTFGVLDSWKEVEEWWDECPEYNDLRKQLDEPSGLAQVNLVKRHFTCPLDIRFRTLDFTGTTVRQAIQKILKFYTHKTFRREIGDHTFFDGFWDDTYTTLYLSS